MQSTDYAREAMDDPSDGEAGHDEAKRPSSHGCEQVADAVRPDRDGREEDSSKSDSVEALREVYDRHMSFPVANRDATVEHEEDCEDADRADVGQ